MPLFGRGSQATVDSKWDNPSHGLSEADFKRWPGRYTPKRANLIIQVEALLASGRMQLPVRLIGQCTTYDRNDGHPAHPAMRHDLTDFIVAGKTQLAVITFHKRADVITGFDPAETLMQTMNDYIDLQFLASDGTPRGRIGFYTGHGHAEEARNQARLVGVALQS